MVHSKQMISQKVYFFLLITLIFAFSVSAQARSVLFFGVFNQKGEHIEPNLEQALRHEFSAASKFNLTNSAETRRYLKESGLFGATPLERIVPSEVKTADSAIAVWVVVKESAMRTGRWRFFWGKIDARLSLDFFISGLNSKEIYYRGLLQADAVKGKEFIFFNSAPKNVHISAIDRSELNGKLHSDIVKSANDIFLTVLNSLSADRDNAQDDYPSDPADDSEETERRIPSVADVFSEPAADSDDQSPNGEEAQNSAELPVNQQNEGMEATITVE